MNEKEFTIQWILNNPPNTPKQVEEQIKLARISYIKINEIDYNVNSNTLTFGKYLGQPINTIPITYLKWCLDKCTSITVSQKKLVEQELIRLNEMKDFAHDDIPY